MIPIHFAPLQGFTDSAYRQAHFINVGGIEAYYTPFLRVEKGGVREKDLRDLSNDIEFIASNQGQTPSRHYRVIPQVICKDSAEFNILVNAIQALNASIRNKYPASHFQGFTEIDINMGCPFPMQAKSGRGSGLLPHTKNIEQILSQVHELATTENKSAQLKFSVKMRLGYTSPDESIALLPLLNATPLNHITLHPRLGIQQYKGALDFGKFREFYEGCQHPLIFNGDVTSQQCINEISDKFPKISGIMIGRGLLANPCLVEPNQDQKSALQALLKIHNNVLDNYRKRLQGDAQILDKVRPFWTYAADTAVLPKQIAKKFAKAKKLSNYLEATDELCTILS